MPNLLKALPRNRSTIALALALMASPALAAQDYPPGLFEKSPVVPSGPPEATLPAAPPDAADPFETLDAVDPPDDYCDGLAYRTFRSLAEVKRAHARCDQLHRAAPLSDSDVPEGMKGRGDIATRSRRSGSTTALAVRRGLLRALGQARGRS